MPFHTDPLKNLNRHASVSEKLDTIFELIQQNHFFISRMSVVLYDEKTDLLKTFISCHKNIDPLPFYQAKLADTPYLQQMRTTSEPRVIDDFSEFNPSKIHTHALLKAGFHSSYTLPMIFNDQFFGFIFFNSHLSHAFSEPVMAELDMMAHMITFLIYNERSNIRTLVATVKSAMEMTHSRDPETGDHLDRVSHYSRLIAKKIAPSYGLDDKFIEYVFLFSPLHDLGKIRIPDSILLKEGKLTEEEREIMRTHSKNGKDMIELLLENYGLDGITHIDMLKNIAHYHHEALNGNGYPEGLSGDMIPLEARIVAVADVFDALTSQRPYKKAWNNADAIAKLRTLSGIKLETDCVNALTENISEIEAIQNRFKENGIG